MQARRCSRACSSRASKADVVIYGGDKSRNATRTCSRHATPLVFGISFFFSNLPNFSAASIPRMHAAEGQFYPQQQGNTLMFIRKQFILHFCWLSGRKTVSSTKHGCMHTHGANLHAHPHTTFHCAKGRHSRSVTAPRTEFCCKFINLILSLRQDKAYLVQVQPF